MLTATLLQPPSVCRTHIQTPEHFALPTGKEAGIMFGSADRTKPKQKSKTGSILAKGKTKKEARRKKWLGKIPWTSALGAFLLLGLLHWLCCWSVAKTEKQMV